MRTIHSLSQSLAAMLLSCVFIYAGLLKMADPTAFAEALDNYSLLPAGTLPVFAYWVPALEICLGLALWLPGFRPAALAGLIPLILIFSLALVQAAARGLDIHCGCFGSSTMDSQIPWALLRNGFLLAASLWLLKAKPRITHSPY